MSRSLSRNLRLIAPLLARNIEGCILSSHEGICLQEKPISKLEQTGQHKPARNYRGLLHRNLGYSISPEESLCKSNGQRAYSTSNFGKHHHERKLLGYTQEQLYAVVSDVSNYKEFVPWCQRSVVTEDKPPDYMEAELEVGFKMFVERYTSQVYMTEPSKVMSKVADSTLFDHLDTTWEFKAGPTPSTTWLNFDLTFAFKSPLYRQIASVFFDEVVKRMMSAFENRCKVLYGESSLHQKRRMSA